MEGDRKGLGIGNWFVDNILRREKKRASFRRGFLSGRGSACSHAWYNSREAAGRRIVFCAEHHNGRRKRSKHMRRVRDLTSVRPPLPQVSRGLLFGITSLWNHHDEKWR